MNNLSEISKKLSHKAKLGEKFLFIIDFDCSEVLIYSPKEAADRGIFYNIDGKFNYEICKKLPEKKRFDYTAISYDEYFQGFEVCQRALQRGDTYLINLTYQTQIKTDYSFEEIFNYSNSKFKLLYKDKFVVFSPERFIKIENGKIETCPMKGTIDGNIPNSREILLEDKKELFEHNTIVDLLRNDLNMVAKNVKVEKFRYIDELVTDKGLLLQVSSKITGDLNTKYNDDFGEIICKLLPAGSVTGAPKTHTVETIKVAENYNRGFYTGVFGFFDGKDTDVAVAIRFIEKEGDILFFKSGGGITALSNPKDEYNELIAKIYVPFF